MTEATTQGDASLTMVFPFHGGWGMKEFKGGLRTNQQKLKIFVSFFVWLVCVWVFVWFLGCLFYIYIGIQALA